MFSHRKRPPCPFASIPTIRRLAGAFAVCIGVALCLATCARAQDRIEADGGPPAPVRETDSCEVTRIVDGDTIDCDPFGRIRLIGMDTPEAGQEPFGDLATEALRERIPVGTVVELERDVEPTDRYDRVLGYLWSEGELINWWLVRAGYAVVLTYPPNVQYVDWFTDAQRQAREEEMGLWAVDGFACEPRAYRRGDCGGGGR